MKSKRIITLRKSKKKLVDPMLVSEDDPRIRIVPEDSSIDLISEKSRNLYFSSGMKSKRRQMFMADRDLFDGQASQQTSTYLKSREEMLVSAQLKLNLSVSDIEASIQKGRSQAVTVVDKLKKLNLLKAPLFSGNRTDILKECINSGDVSALTPLLADEDFRSGLNLNEYIAYAIKTDNVHAAAVLLDYIDSKKINDINPVTGRTLFCEAAIKNNASMMQLINSLGGLTQIDGRVDALNEYILHTDDLSASTVEKILEYNDDELNEFNEPDIASVVNSVGRNGQPSLINLMLRSEHSDQQSDKNECNQCIEQIMTRKVNVAYRDSYGNGLTHYTARFDNLTLTKALVARGAPVNIANQSLRTPLSISVERDISRHVGYFLDQDLDHPLYEKYPDQNPISISIQKDDANTLKSLHQKGFSIESFRDTSGTKPFLHHSFDHQSYDCLNYLLDHCEDPGAVDEKGNTIIMHVVANDHGDQGTLDVANHVTDKMFRESFASNSRLDEYGIDYSLKNKKGDNLSTLVLKSQRPESFMLANMAHNMYAYLKQGESYLLDTYNHLRTLNESVGSVIRRSASIESEDIFTTYHDGMELKSMQSAGSGTRFVKTLAYAAAIVATTGLATGFGLEYVSSTIDPAAVDQLKEFCADHEIPFVSTVADYIMEPVKTAIAVSGLAGSSFLAKHGIDSKDTLITGITNLTMSIMSRGAKGVMRFWDKVVSHLSPKPKRDAEAEKTITLETMHERQALKENHDNPAPAPEKVPAKEKPRSWYDTGSLDLGM